MTIFFYDGSHADCSTIEFGDGILIYDDCRFVSIDDVEKIEG